MLPFEERLKKQRGYDLIECHYHLKMIHQKTNQSLAVHQKQVVVVEAHQTQEMITGHYSYLVKVLLPQTLQLLLQQLQQPQQVLHLQLLSFHSSYSQLFLPVPFLFPSPVPSVSFSSPSFPSFSPPFCLSSRAFRQSEYLQETEKRVSKHLQRCLRGAVLF